MSKAKSSAVDAPATEGILLGLLTAVLYTLFTLLPSSNSNMVSWPWVFLWQISLMLPVLWLLWQLWVKPLPQFALGNRLDWIALLLVVGLVVSTIAAQFPNQARWYAWAALCGLAALYALKGWLTSRDRCEGVLRFQGGLAIAFILLSLILWFSQIYLPELARLQALQPYGGKATFDLSVVSLRNWYLIGHQNYVAGYLVLVLPLLAGLALVSQGWQRWLWGGGLVLGLLDLYTTNSRGGAVAIAALALVAFVVALLFSSLPRRVLLPGGLVALGLVGALFLFGNARLRALLQGGSASGELAYRVITNTVGWRMGSQHPLTGIGLGGVPMAYQQYRPAWAGREAELQYQLHSTPAQLWAELGVWGVLVPLLLVGALVILTVRWARRLHSETTQEVHPWLVWSLLGGLFAYGVLSLTDYQLDNLPISGALLLYLAVLARAFQGPQPLPDAPNRLNRVLAGCGLGLWLAVGLWLIPVHRAWAASSSGFAVLDQKDPNVETFISQLQKAHRFAPWEPYYAYQLGWNLGELNNQAEPTNPASQELRQEAINWFATANQASPHQEFGHSNLGWLLVRDQPQEAVAAFARSAQLVPAKQGVFFGLGFALALADQPDLAVNALALEVMRHPMTLASSIWQVGLFETLREPVLNRLEAEYSTLINQAPADSPLLAYLRQARGGLRWWRGNFDQAAEDWQVSGSPISRAILALAQNQTVDVNSLPAYPGKFAIQAWLTPAERRSLLEQAWVTTPVDVDDLTAVLPPPEIITQLENSLNQASSLDDWLKAKAPSGELRNERLGFGVLARHIDGPQPSDYYVRIENIPMAQFFQDVLPSPRYLPALDNALQPQRDALVAQVQENPA
ncbi:MAG TPA: O-antigen ligase family protein [Leptolyngbyaceae cyanobacterium]